MAGRVGLGFLSRPSYVGSTNRLSYRSYHTAEKIDREYRIHNSQVPTYEQVKSSPELQEGLAKMYESYDKIPTFIESLWSR